jgi:hypothetical protein
MSPLRLTQMVEREFSLNYAVSIHIKFFVWGAAIKHPVMVASLAGSNQMAFRLVQALQ